MKSGTFIQFITLTLVLCIGLTAVIGMAFRVNIAENWDDKRCDPYVVPIAGFFKPTTDGRSATDFASDNWRFCQKEYIQNALRTATSGVSDLVGSQSSTVGIVQDIASFSADVYMDVWKLCHGIYAGFMERMKTAATMFRNFMIHIHSIMGRIDAAVTSITFSLISFIISVINSIQVIILVTKIIVAILLILQILLFFLIWPISNLLMSIAITINIIVISFVAAMAAATSGGEFFASGACFVSGTGILTETNVVSIESIHIGDTLYGGNRVTSIHKFKLNDDIYSLFGIHVTGDHLVEVENTQRIPVRNHPNAKLISNSSNTASDLWCLTTTSRRIPVVGTNYRTVWFADWEEIPDDDEPMLEKWFSEVWIELNGTPPTCSITDATSGVTGDCLVSCLPEWWWLGTLNNRFKPIKDVRIGDLIYDSSGTLTPVVGLVITEGDQRTDSLMLQDGSCIASGSWIFQNGLWINPWMTTGGQHPVRWYHLYTLSGTFVISSHKIGIRDASDVGLENIRRIVESVVTKSV